MRVTGAVIVAGFLDLHSNNFFRENSTLLMVILTLLFLFIVTSIVFFNQKRVFKSAYESTERKFNRFSDVAMEGFSIHNKGYLLEVNYQFAEMLGYTKEELVGKNVFDIVEDDSCESVTESIRNAGENRYELKLKKKDGGIIIAETVVKNFIYHGKEVRASVYWDITERRKREQQITELLNEVRSSNEKLSSSENLLKDMLMSRNKMISVIAHDLRSPLSSIIQSMYLIKDGLNHLTNREITHMLEELGDSAEKTNKLLEELLDWVLSHKHESDVEMSIVDMSEVIQGVLNILKDKLELKSISSQNNIELNSYVIADKRMLATVFRNLLFNAIKFTPRKGSISINHKKSNGFIKVWVSDSGVGVSNKDIKKIFDPNCHFSTYGTEQEKGTGIGLTLCKEFIEKMGGTIWVESTLGKGFSVFFTLRTA